LIVGFLVLTPCGFICWHQCFRGTCCLHLQGWQNYIQVESVVFVWTQFFQSWRWRQQVTLKHQCQSMNLTVSKPSKLLS